MTAGLARFAKIRALHASTTHPGEKEAARRQMEQIARKAGMTVDEAACKLDKPPPAPKPDPQAEVAAKMFNDLFNSPEALAERAEREAKRRVKAAGIIELHGSVDAVFADTPLEAALREACEPLLGSGQTWRTIYRLDGWSGHSSRETMPPRVRKAVSEACPLPATVTEAWAEYEEAGRLLSERCVVEYHFSPDAFTEARRYVVEELLNTLPARSLNDLRARVSWMEFWAHSEIEQDHDGHRTNLATLRADIERMGQRIREQDEPRHRGAACDGPDLGHAEDGSDLSHPRPHADLASPRASVQSGQATDPLKEDQSDHTSSGRAVRRTTADKRRDVLALLTIGKSDSDPLSDREIARRAGVSPTTVGTIRRSLA